MSVHQAAPTEFEPADPSLALVPNSPSEIFARWRGYAQQWMAGAEFSVAEALARARRDRLILHVPRAIDECFDCLGALLAPGTSWEEEDSELRDALFDYARFFPLREALIHGLARIETLAAGGFVVRLYRIDRTGREIRETLFEDELEERSRELREESRQLRDLIRKLLDTLPPAPAEPPE